MPWKRTWFSWQGSWRWKVETEQQVLQTRLVAMDEVRRNLEEWKPVFADEASNLKMKAVEAIGENQFRQLLKERKRGGMPADEGNCHVETPCKK